jgi:hypothetical protein
MGTPTGTVSFDDGTTTIGSSTLVAGSASVTATLAAGAHSITAVYSGDASFTGNTSAALALPVFDFNLTPGTTASSSQTVVPGQAATYVLNLLPVGGTFTFPITLSATGLPPGATATFTPQAITIGASPATVAMTIQTAASSASLHRRDLYGGGVLALSLLLPFSRWTRSRIRGMRPLTLCAALIFSLAAIGGLSGCGSGSGFFAQPPQTYTINVTGTAVGTGGAILQHSISAITLTVQ